MTSPKGGSPTVSNKATKLAPAAPHAPLRLVLASASPRRLGLLAQIGLAPAEVRAADIDESPLKGELPREHAKRLAETKALAVSTPQHTDEIVLGADTVVACGRRMLGKPEDAAEARRFLMLLSGRRHRVHCAIAIACGGALVSSRIVETRVGFKVLSPREIESYIASEEWRGKAGGYAIQGRAGVFVRWLEGSYSGVVGLPLYETACLLEGAGLPVFAHG